MYVYIPVLNLNSHFLPCRFQNSNSGYEDRKKMLLPSGSLYQPASMIFKDKLMKTCH